MQVVWTLTDPDTSCRPSPGAGVVPTSSSWAALGRVSGFLSSAVFRKSLNSKDLKTQFLASSSEEEKASNTTGVCSIPLQVMSWLAPGHNYRFASSMGKLVLSYSDYL